MTRLPGVQVVADPERAARRKQHRNRLKLKSKKRRVQAHRGPAKGGRDQTCLPAPKRARLSVHT